MAKYIKRKDVLKTINQYVLNMNKPTENITTTEMVVRGGVSVHLHSLYNDIMQLPIKKKSK